MAKLTMVRPRLAPARPRLASAAAGEAVRLAERDRVVTWRRLYKTERWRKLRLEVLARDGWTCRQTGVLLAGKYPAPDSAVVDHIRPHRGDEAMFFDPANLQAVSKAWHDSTKQKQERADGRDR